MSQIQNVPFRSLRLSAQSLRQAQILILEILRVFLWLIRLRRIAFLDLEQISADFGLKRFEIGSIFYNKTKLDKKSRTYENISDNISTSSLFTSILAYCPRASIFTTTRSCPLYRTKIPDTPVRGPAITITGSPFFKRYPVET